MIRTYTLCRLLVKIKSKTCVSFSPKNPQDFLLEENLTYCVFVAVLLGCTSTCRMGLCFLWFYVKELPKAQPAVVLAFKRLRRRGNGLKSHPTDWEKPGIKSATPGLQDIGLSSIDLEIRVHN